MLSSMQLLREGNPGRKIAEIQGKLTTVPSGPSAPCTQESGRSPDSDRTVPFMGPQGGSDPGHLMRGRQDLQNQLSCWVALHVSASRNTKWGHLCGAPKC